MGKEGYWGGRSFKRGEAETPSGCMCALFQFFDFHPFNFSIKQQQPPFNSASCVPQRHCDSLVPKGAEAPRNSLESEDGTMASISKEENLKIPENILFIKTSTGSSRGRLGDVNDLSPGIKTPTLVARLMGLDILPDTQSPSSSTATTTTSPWLSTLNPQVNPHLRHLRPRQQHIEIKPRHSMDRDSIAASRSLPETPRISSAGRSDVEHRLSLQIKKENMGIGEDLELARFSFSKGKFEEHSSGRPSHYAGQIVKQVKESVSRKVGNDITNTAKNGGQARGGEFVGQFRSKKSPRAPTPSVSEVLDELSSPRKHSNNPSCSPRLRFMDPMNKPSSTTLSPKYQNSPQPVKFNNQPPLSRILNKAKPQALAEHELQKQKSSVPKCKKAANERFSPQLKKPLQTSDIIRDKQEESFVHPIPSPNRACNIKTTKRKRNHPLSTNLLNLNTIQNINILPVRTDPSPPATKIPQRQVCNAREPKRSSKLSSGTRHTHTKEATSCILGTRKSNDEDKCKGSYMGDGPEFEYVLGILSRTGLVKGTATVSVSFQQWFSPTHPLDPSIFHLLEQQLQYPTPIFTVSSINSVVQGRILRPNNHLSLRCNRRLLFDVVDEILLEILGPYNEKMPGDYDGTHGSQLVETVYKIIGRCRSANCEDLEDIDALIEMEEMGKIKLQSAQALAAEIEGDIMDTLLHETVMKC